jgi:hypothetical protein
MPIKYSENNNKKILIFRNNYGYNNIMRISISFEININNCNFDNIISAIKTMLASIISQIVNQILIVFAELEMKRETKSFKCKCGNNHKFIFKTRNSKRTIKINSIYGRLEIPIIRVCCKECKSELNITKQLLEIDKYSRVSKKDKECLSFATSEATFRGAKKDLQN